MNPICVESEKSNFGDFRSFETQIKSVFYKNMYLCETLRLTTKEFSRMNLYRSEIASNTDFQYFCKKEEKNSFWSAISWIKHLLGEKYKTSWHIPC